MERISKDSICLYYACLYATIETINGEYFDKFLPVWYCIYNGVCGRGVYHQEPRRDVRWIDQMFYWDDCERYISNKGHIVYRDSFRSAHDIVCTRSKLTIGRDMFNRKQL